MGTFFRMCPALSNRAWLRFIAVALLAAGGVTRAQTANPAAPAPMITPTTPGGPNAGWPDRRFLSFSNTVFVPPIMVVSNQVIQVGDFRVTGLSRASGNRKLVAMQLGVPVGLIDRLLEHAAEDPPMPDLAVAQELRGATIEFRFLLAEITGTRPTPTLQQARTNALQALLVGDLPQARDFYTSLHPLLPASNLRIIRNP